ncbi:hypothetical protein HPB49_014542 [Dermacentor silvarum]|uniref:Uncharacterized protein n=1 Tax=Dermacentor silvarum TaxID=543639 RepID=A0ACB8CXS0_DERSI|nr:hypothetical protein HPB49_014542 [Dermacentor silvarum]
MDCLNVMDASLVRVERQKRPLFDMSRKRKALSFKEKIEILKKVDENPKKKRVELAKELGIAPSTLCTIVGQRDVVMKNAQHFGVNVKQAKTATHVKLEEVLLTREEPDEDFGIEGWGSLQTQASVHDFVTADDNVATCGLRSIEELLPSTSESLNALDVLRRTVSAGNVSDETAARFYAFQAGLVNDLEGKKVQANITDFFGRK